MREENVEIFKDTERLCKTNTALVEAIKKSTESQKIYLEKAAMDSFYLPHRKAKNPLHNDNIIYTPDVVIFKTDTSSPKLLNESDWQKVNVITCACKK